MTSWMIHHLTFLATVGAGIMSGVYFAFSGFVMRALDQLDAESAADAMISINKIILKSWFMPLFFGSSMIYLVLLVVAVIDSSIEGRWLLIAASTFYLVGMFLCTVFFNVPLNNRLADSSGDLELKKTTWNQYVIEWTRWNHLRTGCSLASMILGVCFLVIYGNKLLL